MASPLLSSSIPFVSHPDTALCAKEADAYAAQSLKAHTSQLKIHRAQVPLCACFMLPKCNSYEKMLLVSKYCTGVVFLDDTLELSPTPAEAELVIDLALSFAAGKDMSPGELNLLETTPNMNLFMETITELRFSMSKSLFSRHLLSLRRSFDAVVKEVGFRTSKVVPTTREFAMFRGKTTYIEPCGAALAEFGEDIELDSAAVQLPQYLMLVDAVCDHVGLVNDVFSFQKDYHEKCWHNWLYVMLHGAQGQMTLDQVLQQVYDKIREIEALILRLQNELLEIAGSENNIHLGKFATSFPYVASGHFKYCTVSRRYPVNPALTPKIEGLVIDQVKTMCASSVCV